MDEHRDHGVIGGSGVYGRETWCLVGMRAMSKRWYGVRTCMEGDHRLFINPCRTPLRHRNEWSYDCGLLVQDYDPMTSLIILRTTACLAFASLTNAGLRAQVRPPTTF